MAVEVREHLVRAREADLVGPCEAGGEEVLRLPLARWYLTGFLAPAREPRAVELAEDRLPDEDPLDDGMTAGDDQDDDEAAGADPAPKHKLRLPSSMGTSALWEAPW